MNLRQLMADAKFYESYSRYDESKGRYETWDEAVTRVMDMHRKKYADCMTEELQEYINIAEKAYKDRKVLGAQRALQFGGEELMRHQMKLYNCTASWCDRAGFFGEYMYMLLCGAGAGFSVQKHHIAQLPIVMPRTEDTKTYVIEDSIEGWAEAADVLMSSYLENGGVYPQYSGCKIHFDLTKIRPKGAKISGGFLAPGPEPLRKALDHIERLLERYLENYLSRELSPIVCYDICMYLADAVIAGGVRRSATICLFSPDDEEMINAKTGNWLEENPQRARSNNSAVIVRDEITAEEFHKFMDKIKQFGEPGFVFVDNKNFAWNPLKLAA